MSPAIETGQQFFDNEEKSKEAVIKTQNDFKDKCFNPSCEKSDILPEPLAINRYTGELSQLTLICAHYNHKLTFSMR